MDNPKYEDMSEEEKSKPENIINSYYEDEGGQYKNEYKAFFDLHLKYSKEILDEKMIQIDEFIDFLTFEGLLLNGDSSIENFLYAIQFYRYLEEVILQYIYIKLLILIWKVDFFFFFIKY